MNYLQPTLPETLPDDPMPWLEAWLSAAISDRKQPNPNAMTLVTVSPDSKPSARVVLCKEIVTTPGYIVFYTNYESRKAAEIDARPDVCAVFHWDHVGRQVRVEGTAVRSPEEESDRYFQSRGAGSRLGAWSSDQSRPIASRARLFEQRDDRARSLGIALDDAQQPESGADIPRPPHWGGYRIWARRVELWLDGADRIHDRAAFEREVEPGETPGPWSATRLQP